MDGDHGGVFCWGLHGDNFYQSVRSHQPGQPADDCNHYAFDEDLSKDIEVGSADGFANSNFAHSFVDASQHDVEDSNATYQQADGRNNPATHAGVANGAVDLAGEEEGVTPNGQDEERPGDGEKARIARG